MLLDLRNLDVDIAADEAWSPILRKVSFTIDQGQTVALVGESGSGKSVTALSTLRLLEKIASVRTTGEILFEGRDLLRLPEPDLQRIRGNRIAMIFQEPMTSLNPVYTIGDQLMEPLGLHQGLDKRT
nr:ATP-binding cassette domain-containing protein [Desulfobacteraceae bacterium]